MTRFFTESAGPTSDGRDDSDRTSTRKLCFDFMSKDICVDAFCPSQHLCTDLGSWLQEMESMSVRCV